MARRDDDGAPMAPHRARSWWRMLVLPGAAIAVALVVVVAVRAGSPSVRLLSGVVNDGFANAEAVTGGSVTGTTVGATTEPAEVSSGEADAGQETAWYSWTPTSSGLADLTPLSAGDTGIRVFSGTTLGSLTRVDLSGSSPTSGPLSGVAGSVAIPAIAATTYWIQISSPPGGGSAFTYVLTQSSAGAPVNDNFANPTALDAAVSAFVGGSTAPATIGTTAGTTLETGDPGIGSNAAANSVWYSIAYPNSTASVTLTVTTLGEPVGSGTGGLYAGAFTGASLTTLTPVATTDTSGHITIAPGAAGTVMLAVDGPAGYFTIAVTAASGFSSYDTTPPTVTCTPPTGWVQSATVPCTATDTGSPLVKASDAAFNLTAVVSSGSYDAQAVTGTENVCDVAGNCTTAGPYTVEVDEAPPTVDCTQPPKTWSSGNVTVTCAVADTGSGLAPGTPTTISLSTSVADGVASDAATFSSHAPVCDAAGNCTTVPTPAAVEVDGSAPVVTCGSAPTGWLDQQGSVACTATAGGSGLANSGDASFSLKTTVPDGTTDPDATTNTYSVCNAVGNCTSVPAVSGIKVDLGEPQAKCGVPTTWQKGTSVTITCTVSDAGSGLAAGSPPTFTLSASIPAGTASADAATKSEKICDVAGGCTTVGPYGVSLDDAPPTITCTPPPTTWQPGTVTVGCVTHDPGPGLTDPTAAEFQLTADAAPGTASSAVAFGSRTVCDTVGWCATTPTIATVKIDRVKPRVSCDPVSGGVRHLEVVIGCTASDGGSGLADPANGSFDLWTSVGRGNADASARTSSRAICDAVGNCVKVGPFTANVDLTTPAVGPAPTFTLPSEVEVLVAEHLTDGHSTSVPVPFDPPVPHGGLGIVQHACNPSTGGLFSFGYTLVTCGATDQADQSSVASFYVTEEPAPALAPSGPMVADGGWRVVGADFAPGSTVSVTLDGAALTSAPVDSAGRVDALVTIPRAAPIGDGYLVVAGTDALTHPLYIVTPLTLDAAGHTDVVAPVPSGAPAPVTVTVKLPPRAPRSAPPRILVPGKSESTHVGSVIPSATAAGTAGGTAWWAYLLIALGGAVALGLGGAVAGSPVLRRRVFAKVRRR